MPPRKALDKCASVSTAVQAKLTSDQIWNFPRLDVDTGASERGRGNRIPTGSSGMLMKQVRGVIMVNNNLQIQNRTPAGKISSAEIENDAERNALRLVDTALSQPTEVETEQVPWVCPGLNPREIIRVSVAHEAQLIANSLTRMQSLLSRLDPVTVYQT